jgi:hypothetical protein
MPHAGWPIGGREHALQRAHLKVRCVDKDSGRAIGVSQVSFQDLNCERQMVTHELRRLQDDDSVLDGCVTFATNPSAASVLAKSTARNAAETQPSNSGQEPKEAVPQNGKPRSRNSQPGLAFVGELVAGK